MDPVDVESRIFLTRKTSIYKVLHLVHEDWILEQHRTLSLCCNHHFIERQVEVLTDIGQGERPRPVHSRLAVHVDDSSPLAKERMEFRLEFRVPVEDVGVDAVDAIEAEIPLGVAIREPLRTRAVVCTVDDVGDVHLGCEALC